MKKLFKKILQNFSLLLLDLASYFTAVFLSVFFRSTIVSFFVPDLPSFTFSLVYTASLYWIPMVIIVFFFFARLYNSRFPFWEETRMLVKSLTLSLFFIALTYYISQQRVDVLRLYFLLLWIISMVIFPLYRFWGKKLLFKLGLWHERVMILGSGDSAIATLKGISQEEHLGYKVLGFLDDDAKKSGKELIVNNKKYRIYGKISEFQKYVTQLDVDTVFIAAPYPPEILKNLVNHVYKYVRRVIIIPDIQGVSIFNSELHYLFTEKLFMIKVHNSLISPFNMFIKRLFDLSLSILGSVVVLPLFLVLMLLIKVWSRGPVFFIQKRLGKNGRVFNAIKFRSMYVDAEERLNQILTKDEKAKEYYERYWKLKDDPRITPIGRFLRRTSLDELPQLINVLKGQMSLIGPRPYLPEEIDKIGEPFNIINTVIPGMTGLWQVSGRSETNYEFRVQTDIWYVQNWSLWLDIIILVRTPLEVIKAKGAY